MALVKEDKLCAAKPDRFDLEQAITEQWQIADDLELLASQVLESDLSQDEIVNVLNGVAALHRMRCGKADDILGQLIESGQLR